MFDSFGIACLAATSVAFLAASVGKASRPAAFSETLDVAASALSPAARRVFVVTLPLLEFVLAVALWPVATRRAAAIGCAGLLVIFGAVALWTEHRGESVGCNCFGVGNAKLGVSTAARNAVLLVPALVSAVGGNRIDVSGAPSWMPLLIATLGVVASVSLTELAVDTWRGASAFRDATTLQSSE